MIEQYHIAHDWPRYEQFRLKKKTGLVSGYPEIDKAVPCLPGLTTLVGDTKLGKSYFTMNIYLNLAKKGIPVLLIDKENGSMRTRTRLICCLSGLTDAAVNSGKFIDNERELYDEAVTNLANLPIYYRDQLYKEDLEKDISEIGKTYNKRVFVVIDSVNRLVDDFENRRGDIDSWFTIFNNIKLKYDNFVNFWVICEKNKEGKTKESNSIDYLSELWLEMYKDKTGGVVLNCKAQRDGPSGVIATFHPKVPFCYQMEAVEYIPE